MRTIRTTFETLGGRVLVIGRKGESGASEVLIDCAEAMGEYQGTTPVLSLTAPDGTIYPGTITQEDGVVKWTVTGSDTAKAGSGSMRVDLVDGNGTVVTSAETGTRILHTNKAESGTAPDPIADWVAEANEKLEEVQDAMEALEEERATVEETKSYLGID